MKSKKWLWRLFAVLMLAVVLFCVYRRCSSVDYLRMLPARPKALVSVDLIRLSEESGLDAEALKDLLPQAWNEEKTGIDWKEKIYAFVSSKEYMGLLAAVEDAGELEKFLEKQSREGRCRPVERRQGCSWTILDERWMMGFDDRALLVMGPGFGGDMDVLRQEILKCFRQEEEESGSASSVYKDLNSQKAAFAIVSRMDVFPSLYDETFRSGLPEHADLNDVNVIATVHFTEKGVEIDGEINSANPDVNKYYEQLTHVGGKMSGMYAEDVPADALAWGCVNVEGDALLEQLRAIPDLRTFLLGLNLGIDADRMIRSIKGDMAVTLFASDCLKNTYYLMTARLENTDFLKEAGYWLQSAAQGGAVTLREVASQRYYISAQGMQAFFGVDGETLYVTSAERNAPHAGGNGDSALSAWKNDIASDRFFFWLNIERLKQMPEVSMLARMSDGSSLQETLDLFSCLTLQSSDARHVNLNFYTKENKHALKALLRQWIR